MKDKILVFIIGLLVGAILATSGLLIYDKINANQMPGGEQMQMMQRPDGETPPEMPNGGTPPEKPSDMRNNSEVPQMQDSNTNQKSN